MGIEATTKNYWIAPNAISISLNALGDANRTQGSVASGSVISCYIESVKPESSGEEYAGNGDGLGLDNGRNPKRWPLVISPTYFNSDTAKYVYAAIPRKASFGTQAVIVFPSERIDLYGKNENDQQIGSSDYFYVWLQGIISAPTGDPLQREWTQDIAWGLLGTYEDIVDMSESDWYQYSGATETVTFLKRIVMKVGSYFENIFLGDHELTGVATAATADEYINSDTLVATPSYIRQHYLRRDADDTATGLVGFAKGLWVKAAGMFGFSEDGDVVARSLKATGSSGGTVADIDNATRKNIGLEVAESGIIGGIFRVAKAILTKTIQSINFTGTDSMFGTGWQLTDNDGNGNSRLVVDNLFVRMKAVFNELEVRKYVAMGGNYVFSPAASIIEEVDYIGLDENDNEVVLGYEYVKVPWVLRLVPLSIARRMLSRKKMVRTSAENIDFSEVVKFRCWLKSDDGTTRTINTWQVGMLARCQTFDISHGSGSHDGTWNGNSVTNKLYWRAVTAIGQALTKDSYALQNHILEDGLTHNYIDLANYTDENDVQLYLTGSDNPEAFDNIVCYGDWLDRSLSNLITIETVGTDAPAIKEMLGIGYTDGTSIDWHPTDKERTRISPVAGNKFVAPSFVVTTDGEADRTLYSEVLKGTALGFEGESGVPGNLPPAGSIMLVPNGSIVSDMAIKVLSYQQSISGLYEAVWTATKVNKGDAYVSQKDGHRYVYTPDGWEDRGLNDESKSSLKVDLNGIEARVESIEGAGYVTELELTSQGGAIYTLVDGLETAGIHIDGANSNITLFGDKVTFQNTAGSLLTPKIWIDATDGTLHATNADITGKITASEGAIGPFNIGDYGLYTGNIENWKTSGSNFAYIHESAVRIAQKITYNDNEIASIKVFAGKDSDPNVSNSDLLCDSALYIERRMSGNVAGRNQYKPAVQIKSNNVGSVDVAMRLEGALQVWGGILERGRYMYYTGTSPYNVNVFNLNKGTTFLVKSTVSGATLYFPTLSEVQTQLGLPSGEPFCVRVTVIAAKGTAAFIITATDDILDHGCNQWGSNDWGMEQGDVAIVCLCYDGSTYWIQEIDTLD